MLDMTKVLTVIGIVLAAGFFLGVNAASAEGLAAESDVRAPDADGNGIPEITEAALAERFCPYVVMHEKQILKKPKYEEFRHCIFPQDVHIMLDTGFYGRRVKFVFWPYYAINSNIEEAVGVKECKPEDFITFGGDKGHNERIDRDIFWPVYYKYLVEKRGLYTKPHVYYNIFRDNVRRPVIQYWFFYPYNSWANDHEGDWEHINVRVTSIDPNAADVAEVVYYFHKWYKTIPAASEELETFGGTHPVVYVGGQPKEWINANFEASGGSYWKAGDFPRVGEIESVSETVIAGEGSKICRPEDFTKIWIGKTEANPEAWWLEFPGYWGRVSKYLLPTHPESELGEEPPRGPWHHHCWEIYQHPDYHEYGDRAKAASQKP